MRVLVADATAAHGGGTPQGRWGLMARQDEDLRDKTVGRAARARPHGGNSACHTT